MLHGCAGEHGRVLAADSVASLVEPSFRPDPRVAGVGLGFDRYEERGRTSIGTTGVVSGFQSAFGMAPEDGVGVVVLGNTGSLAGRGVPAPLSDALSRLLVGLPEDLVRDDVPPRPDVWPALCGWYAPDAGPNTDVFARLAMGAGVEVGVRHGELVLTSLTPVPGMRTRMVLHPDDPSAPRVHRVVLPPPQLLFDLMSIAQRPGWRNPRRRTADRCPGRVLRPATATVVGPSVGR